MEALFVFREVRGVPELVGTLSASQRQVNGGDSESLPRFSYDQAYLVSVGAAPLSARLPLQADAFDVMTTRSFFDGLLPEGSMRKLLDKSVHGNAVAFDRLLARLNDESAGALLFCDSPSVDLGARAYEELGISRLRDYAQAPESVAIELNMRSRLSLAGAQTKVGLYHTGDDPLAGWYVPRGGAPSTHIVKVERPDGPFPHETVNEAFCLSVARACGFDTAKYLLVALEGLPPLLAVERFDRMMPDGPDLVGGMPTPHRMHQEDFCQAAGVSSALKYEPTDGHYLSLCADTVSRCSSNPFGDRMMLFGAVLLDYLLGNCDNHLKNYSFTWDASWQRREMSPLYDLTCTTMYPQIYREMGVSLCASRRIDDVTRADIVSAGRALGLGAEAAWNQYADLRAEFFAAIDYAEEMVVAQGFDSAHEVARFIRDDALARTIPA